MAPNRLVIRGKFISNSIILICIIASLVFATPVQAMTQGNFTEWDSTEAKTSQPNYFNFVESVKNGQTGVLRGVYIPRILALPIIQQPVGHPEFISGNYGEVTQFNMAAQAGNIGLLAHNNLSGEIFSNILPGQEVRLIYGDGRVEKFTVSQVLRYQALEPYNPYSKFRDLETDILITAEELYRKMYLGNRHVTFQTCIAANGDESWGRLFIIAQPKTPTSYTQYEVLDATNEWRIPKLPPQWEK